MLMVARKLKVSLKPYSYFIYFYFIFESFKEGCPSAEAVFQGEPPIKTSFQYTVKSKISIYKTIIKKPIYSHEICI